MLHFCTIVTPDFIGYANALCRSLRSVCPSFQLHTLVTGEIANVYEATKAESSKIAAPDPELVCYSTNELCSEGVGQSLHQKYWGTGDADAFRWSMKSVFMMHLLTHKCERLCFVDPDIAFFHDPTFLFDQLSDCRVLLTPHWRCPDPNRDPGNFAILQTSGLFNAGFVGVSEKAVDALTWWANVCLHRCEIQPTAGLYVDQAYLDLMPIYFEGVEIVRHRGCNVANWNLTENIRSLVAGETLINDEFPIIFIHFTASTVRGILAGEDEFLRPHLDRWLHDRGAHIDEYINQASVKSSPSRGRATATIPERILNKLQSHRKPN